MGDLGTQTPHRAPVPPSPLSTWLPSKDGPTRRKDPMGPCGNGPLQAVPQIKKENPKPLEPPNGPRDGPLRASTCVTKPIEVPSFDPRVPPRRRPRPPARQWRLRRRQKRKVADRHSGNRIPTQGRRRRQWRRGGLRCRGHYGNKSGPWGTRHGLRQSLAWNQKAASYFPSQRWAWSVPSSANCV